MSVARLTVDRLKAVLRAFNNRLLHGHKMSGRKAELIDRVRSSLNQARDSRNLTDYATMREILINADNLSAYSGSTTASYTAPAPAPAPPAPAPAAAAPPLAPYVPPRNNLPPTQPAAAPRFGQPAWAPAPAPVASSSTLPPKPAPVAPAYRAIPPPAKASTSTAIPAAKVAGQLYSPSLWTSG